MNIRQIVRVSDQGVSQPYQCSDENGFDEFIRNGDRTDDNTNLLSNAGVHVIDHNNAFDPAFDREVFLREHALRRFRTAVDPSVVAAFAERIRQVVTERFLDEVWSEMPVEWTEVGRENVIRYGAPQAVFSTDPAAELDDLYRRSVQQK